MARRRYDFEIHIKKEHRCATFSIRAIYKSTGAFSSINNMNVILDVLGVEGSNPKYADSLWVLTNREADHYENVITRQLSSPDFVNYLEGKLDEDRECGEWANSIYEIT
ncbi:MAG: hypothetical protein Q8O43_01420 [Dehalococcoidia bacterium]|nr:hypothetical protein [Dehalococcoidia bacterium]